MLRRKRGRSEIERSFQMGQLRFPLSLGHLVQRAAYILALTLWGCQQTVRLEFLLTQMASGLTEQRQYPRRYGVRQLVAV